MSSSARSARMRTRAKRPPCTNSKRFWMNASAARKTARPAGERLGRFLGVPTAKLRASQELTVATCLDDGVQVLVLTPARTSSVVFIFFFPQAALAVQQ